MTTWHQARRCAALIARTPSIVAASAVYSGLIYLATMQADVLDIGNRWWILTVAVVLLLSPVYHAFVIRRAAASLAGETFHWRDVPLETFGSLVAGELLINAGVVLGSVFFVLPGVYIGLRSIYYKQLIVLRKSGALPAARGSFALTVDVRRLGRLLTVLGLSYLGPLAIDFFVVPASLGGWSHVVAVLVSTTFVCWVNAYLTLSFQDLVADMTQATNGPGAS